MGYMPNPEPKERAQELRVSFLSLGHAWNQSGSVRDDSLEKFSAA